MRTAHDRRKSKEPTDHLVQEVKPVRSATDSQEVPWQTVRVRRDGGFSTDAGM